MMVVPPDKPCLSFPKQFKAVFPGQAYSGLSARAMEYFINYGITGATSVYVIMMFNSLGLGSSSTDIKKDEKFKEPEEYDVRRELTLIKKEEKDKGALA